VTFSDAATYVVNLNATTATADLLEVNGGTLTLSSGVKLEVTVSGGEVAGGTAFVIAEVIGGGSIIGKFEGTDGTASVVSADGQKFDISYSTNSSGNQVVVLTGDGLPHGPRNPTSVAPEPSTYAAFGGVGLLLLAFWRKRRKSRQQRNKAQA
jgi:hypothetical protein